MKAVGRLRGAGRGVRAFSDVADDSTVPAAARGFADGRMPHPKPVRETARCGRREAGP